MNTCILRLNRHFDGAIGSTSESTYSCGRSRQTGQLHTNIAWRIGGSRDCDETKNILPSCLLEVQGETTLRRDGFAYFKGRGFLKKVQPETKYFRCTLELISHISSHQFLGENCNGTSNIVIDKKPKNVKEHVEGCLIGQGLGDLDMYALRGIIAGEASFPNGSALDTRLNIIAGVVARTL